MRVMVVDDEKYMLQNLVELLKQEGAEVVAEFTRPKEALNWFKEKCLQIDAVFLDVNMPVLNGFALADVMLKINENVAVVFVTSYDQYAVQAFEMEALDYILKPAVAERIRKTLQRISSKAENSEDNTKSAINDKAVNEMKLHLLDRNELWEKKHIWSALLKKMSGEHLEDVLLFNDGNWEWVAKKQVSSFSKNKSEKYIQVIANNKNYETVEKMADFLSEFEQENFIMCFRAVYVNLNQVEKLEKGIAGEGAYLLLKNSDIKIPVSRNYLNDVIIRFNSYL